LSPLFPCRLVDHSCPCLRDGIGTGAAAPGIAAQDSFDRKPGAAPPSVFLQGSDGVVGAGGGEAAHIADEGGEAQLVETDQSNEKGLHRIWNTWTTKEMITSIKMSQMTAHSRRLEWEWFNSEANISNNPCITLSRWLRISTRVRISR